MLQLTHQYFDQIKCGDQDILNYVFAQNCLLLDQRYNYEVRLIYQDIANYIRGEVNFIHPTILHFSDILKPWSEIKEEMLFYVDEFNQPIGLNILPAKNLYDFYASLNWQDIMNLPVGYYKSIAQQIYQANFDYFKTDREKFALHKNDRNHNTSSPVGE
ncbi:hypothetical protein A4G19_07035 [Pasteurellaceae bacterium Macca]|nr:hypothetical protein [Pasteurellaceae bacterium Macca]